MAGWKLTTGAGGKVLDRGSLYAAVLVSYHKHFVQNGSVVHKTLKHTGGMDISQTGCTEEQTHLQHGDHMRLRNGNLQEYILQLVVSRYQVGFCEAGKTKSATSCEYEPCATLVLQTEVRKRGSVCVLVFYFYKTELHVTSRLQSHTHMHACTQR